MSDVKQVKVDNWGIYFLQRLKHFFNRTDYCDLTLQFQDNAQLKVHRLVLNACTEYFELLERTCEMYEDCLVMPEDLQADVVVPIVNFMYTGQLEFKMDALERLYQTSQIMNMPVLTKLLEAHRDNHNHLKNSSHYGSMRRYSKPGESSRQSILLTPTTSSSGKRSYAKAFENNKTTSNSKGVEPERSIAAKTSKKKDTGNREETVIYRDRKLHYPASKSSGDNVHRLPSPIPLDTSLYNKRLVLGDPRPTRYELPEELDTDNIFDTSFSNISYTTQPLMVHPETTKQYSSKKAGNAFNEPTSSKKSFKNTVDIVECKKVSKNDSIFEDDLSQNVPDDNIYQSAFLSMKDASPKDPGQLFDQILDNNESPKVTIEAKDKQAGNLDHAKIISEVLKKYPHLVKSNKNIKLKILNTPTKVKKNRTPTVHVEQMKEKLPDIKPEVSYTYETDVLDSKEAAKLISLGADNVKGPWICLICGTPGRALNFTSYYNFRRHLVEIHKEKPVSTICEYCGLKSFKRNYLLHHIYTKHGVPPPQQYHFPKCPSCDYVALTEGFLIKHKLTHSDTKMPARCIVCSKGFSTGTQLVLHIKKTGHKQQITADKKHSIQCTYCMKVFQRDNNFYCHLKTSHKEQAVKDGVIEESDDEIQSEDNQSQQTVHEVMPMIKHEHSGFENELEEEDMPYQPQKRLDGSLNMGKKTLLVSKNMNQKILNTGFNPPATIKQIQKPKVIPEVNTEYIHDIDNPSHGSEGNIVVINDVEYIMKDNQLIPRKPSVKQAPNDEYILSDFIPQAGQMIQDLENVAPTTSMDITNMHQQSSAMVQQPKMILKKSATLNQPIQIVVSNEEEYKALMASNHSIIFDDSDPNKTLTVLTAPQTTTIDTTGIDLDNTQSNDMMIIQEDYPLNVSEAVSGDNSKYVVVYSHAMDQNDPTKQFQILTQDIGAQYIQTSAVLTQNYDTITTPAPVINANVVGTQMEESWHQNSEHNVNNQATMLVGNETELHTITEQTNVNDGNTLIHLPEAQILSVPTNVDQAMEVTLEPVSNINPDVKNNQASNVDESMNIEIPEVEAEREDTIVDETRITAEHEIETECQEDRNTKTENITKEPYLPVADSLPEPNASPQIPEQLAETSSAPQPPKASLIVAEQAEMSLSVEHGENIIDESGSVDDENINAENVETDATNTIERNPESQENDVMKEVSSHPENVKSPPPQTKEQIQNLASEWSEDEYDVVTEESESNENNISENKEQHTQEPELEESIENIQQEVQKQISEVDDADVATEVENVSTENVDTNVDQLETVQPNKVIGTGATQEKISSLLNDWEDNDSQEDNTSITENGDDNTATIDSNENDTDVATNTNENDTDAATNQTNALQTTIVETKKDDNIKSLVSDWDEEEEENKE